MLKISEDKITGVKLDVENEVLRPNTIKTINGLVSSEENYFCFKVKGIAIEYTYIGKSTIINEKIEGQIFNSKLAKPSDGKKFKTIRKTDLKIVLD